MLASERWSILLAWAHTGVCTATTLREPLRSPSPRLRALPATVPRALQQPIPGGRPLHHRGWLPWRPLQKGQVWPSGHALQHRELGL